MDFFLRKRLPVTVPSLRSTVIHPPTREIRPVFEVLEPRQLLSTSSSRDDQLGPFLSVSIENQVEIVNESAPPQSSECDLATANVNGPNNSSTRCDAQRVSATDQVFDELGETGLDKTGLETELTIDCFSSATHDDDQSHPTASSTTSKTETSAVDSGASFLVQQAAIARHRVVTANNPHPLTAAAPVDRDVFYPDQHGPQETLPRGPPPSGKESDFSQVNLAENNAFAIMTCLTSVPPKPPISIFDNNGYALGQ